MLIEHRAERTAKVVGRLGEKAAREGAAVRGLLVQARGGGRTLMHHEDLPRFTKLHPGRVMQRQAMALHRPFTEVGAGACGSMWAGMGGGRWRLRCCLPARQPGRTVHGLLPVGRKRRTGA